MKISFVIPAYNEEKYLGRCLESIEKHWTDECLEIIVVDNNSTDRTAEIARGFTHATVIAETKKGTNWARQRGFKESKGDLIALLDADIMMPDGWMEQVRQEFSAHPEVVSLSGPFQYYDLAGVQKMFMESLWTVFAPFAAWVTGYALLAANAVIRREALAAIGGFDTNFVFYGDDTDTARRLSKIGKVKWSVPFSILGSGRRLVSEGMFKTVWRYGINYVWTAYGHKPHDQGAQDAHR